MMDLILRVCPKEKLRFVFFDTGLEYAATKRHLPVLEERYGVEIERVRAAVPAPLAVKKMGSPFLSKDIATAIRSLQYNHFDFANDGDRPYEELLQKYPHPKSSIGWWCNERKNGYDIGHNAYLKEFMMDYPPTFPISARCCEGSKKRTAHMYDRGGRFDLKCMGMRKAEGGQRSSSVKNCYSFNSAVKMQKFYPLWWLTNSAVEMYIHMYDVPISDCYTIYGMKRTGCAGCPFNSRFEDDLKIVAQYEPNLCKAANHVFADSYAYTRAYREYKEKRKAEAKKNKNMPD